MARTNNISEFDSAKTNVASYPESGFSPNTIIKSSEINGAFRDCSVASLALLDAIAYKTSLTGSYTSSDRDSLANMLKEDINNIIVSTTVNKATKAEKDGDGNEISSTYLKLSGGTMTSDLNFTDATGIYFKDTLGNKRHVKIIKDSVTSDKYTGTIDINVYNGSSLTNENILCFDDSYRQTILRFPGGTYTVGKQLYRHLITISGHGLTSTYPQATILIEIYNYSKDAINTTAKLDNWFGRANAYYPVGGKYWTSSSDYSFIYGMEYAFILGQYTFENAKFYYGTTWFVANTVMTSKTITDNVIEIA